MLFLMILNLELSFWLDVKLVGAVIFTEISHGLRSSVIFFFKICTSFHDVNWTYIRCSEDGHLLSILEAFSLLLSSRGLCIKALPNLNWICKNIKKRLQHRCFPLKFAKFWRTPILNNICERLLLQINGLVSIG